ncbi:MAG: NAD(P)H-binding protein [Corynebacterium sp.]|uniref:NAD(P)H-binding protein n=1 Tax=Corynebacterium sp. TaxID=1720 RepID=UPI003F91ED38
MFLITGATGNVGGELATILAGQGHAVRAYVRNPARASHLPEEVELAVGDLDDAEALRAACEGVDTVFFMQAAPSPTQAETLVDVATVAGVTHVVVLSSIGTVLHPMPVIGAAIDARDEVLRSSSLEVTYLRPNTLTTNALWWREVITAGRPVPDPTGEGLTGPVDPYDIARVAAAVMTDPTHRGHGYILNGPEALSTREQVRILADVLGREIAVADCTPGELAEASIAAGTPEPQARGLQDLQDLFRAGRSGVLTDDVRNVTGVAPRSFRRWCELHRDDFGV